jgi:hypothetical protein
LGEGTVIWRSSFDGALNRTVINNDDFAAIFSFAIIFPFGTVFLSAAIFPLATALSFATVAIVIPSAALLIVLIVPEVALQQSVRPKRR